MTCSFMASSPARSSSPLPPATCLPDRAASDGTRCVCVSVSFTGKLVESDGTDCLGMIVARSWWRAGAEGIVDADTMAVVVFCLGDQERGLCAGKAVVRCHDRVVCSEKSVSSVVVFFLLK